VRRSNWDTPAAGGDAGADDPVARMAAIQQQQLMMQQQHQALLMQQQAAAAAQAAAIAQATTAAQQPPVNEMALDAPPTAGNKKQRELYIGNLAVGVVHSEMLRELFNAVLGHMVSGFALHVDGYRWRCVCLGKDPRVDTSVDSVQAQKAECARVYQHACLHVCCRACMPGSQVGV